MIEEILQETGLTPRESKCYIALLEAGPSTGSDIAKRTGIPLSKIYEVLGKLIKNGVASRRTKNKTKYYQACNPKTLLRRMEDVKKRFEETLPLLLAKEHHPHQQQVELFDGQKAVFALFTSLIADAKANEQYLVFSIDEENKSESANRFFRNLATRRKEHRLDTRVLKNRKRFTKEKHTKLKMRHTALNLPQGITVFRDNVIILSWTEQPLAIKIQSNAVAAQWKQFFNDAWDSAQ